MENLWIVMLIKAIFTYKAATAAALFCWPYFSSVAYRWDKESNEAWVLKDYVAKLVTTPLFIAFILFAVQMAWFMVLTLLGGIETDDKW